MALNINRLVLDGINLAMSLTPDVQKTVTYKRSRGSGYDPSTGEVTRRDTVATGIAAIITPYSESELDGETIKMGDEKCVIRFADLVAQGIESPDVHDMVIEAGGLMREVVGISLLDPTRQVLKLHLRSHGGLNRGVPVYGENEEPVEADGPVFG